MEEVAEKIAVTPLARQWDRIAIKQHHGINIPLFSIHSASSCGIGEFPDLIPLLTWCKEVGLSVLQLLPLNDTGLEAGPYGAISAFALNPIHLGIAALPHINDHSTLRILLKMLLKMAESPRIDYKKLHEVRSQLLREYFQLHVDRILTSDGYIQFRKDNPWLEGYALFKTLKINFHWRNWESWPEEIRNPTQETIQQLCERQEGDIAYHMLIQYLCFEQFKKVREHADQIGMLLKGDIPILINRQSADVWLNRPIFDLQFCAGAPPDAYSEVGQNWGFPLYNWEELKKTGYAWWKTRLAVAERLYHIYRIDHIVGFFRIWAIPLGREGNEGHFIPEDDSLWTQHGEEIMQMMIETSSMLPIGEDLGTVPNDVRKSLHKLGICGTKVMRWERRWEGDKGFIHPNDYPPLSMTTVSTHDSETLQLWWMKNPEEAKEYAKSQGWAYSPILSREHHFSILYNSHHTASLFHINLLQEYLALFPGLVWQNPEDERINIPNVISDRNWSYRFRPSLETIIADNTLKAVFKDFTSK